MVLVVVIVVVSTTAAPSTINFATIAQGVRPSTVIHFAAMIMTWWWGRLTCGIHLCMCWVRCPFWSGQMSAIMLLQHQFLCWQGQGRHAGGSRRWCTTGLGWFQKFDGTGDGCKVGSCVSCSVVGAGVRTGDGWGVGWGVEHWWSAAL